MAGSSPGFNASPRYSASPSQQQQANFVPSDRALPAADNVSSGNIDEIYAAFVLYCNPYFPSNHDTSELKKIFKKPPMSDNKTFDPYNLFELLKKLEKGEIKTWIQLALDLGVEPPDVEKGQSTQKVQQYAVRLKHTGGPVHLVTPTVLVNGESNSPDKQPNSAEAAIGLPKVTREMLKRLLAADLLRADLSGRRRMRGHEAKDLADAILTQLSSQNEPSGAGGDAVNQGLANWLGFSTHLGLGLAPVPSGIKKIDVQKYRVSEDGYESPIDADDGEREDSALALGEGSKIKETFDVSWSLTMGGCTGKFSVKGLMIESKGAGENEGKDGGEGLPNDEKEKSLEEKVKDLEAQLKGKDREVQLWRQRVLEAVL
ncbi:hypothetical protein SLS55_006166 [Diplodia seriata]|uniref:Uncharacterized protein n=1 Tax=Diplodia seriata TaxID=420778 RepID=A0ABR3CDJ8_9PEZI